MSRNFDSSSLTQRRAQRTIAGNFLSASNNITWQSRPLLGNKDSSMLYDVKLGNMTEYTRYPTCVGISLGGSCAGLQTAITNGTTGFPGYVSGITFTVGSIIVSWSAPTTGDGPFTYVVTPYLNGVAQPSVTTTQTTYRFTNLSELQPYTFTVCAQNAVGTGPLRTTPSFVAPPSSLAPILQGQGESPMDISGPLTYVVNLGLDTVMAYAASINQAPTVTSRLLYLWAATVAQASNWVSTDTCVTGTQDGWNWDTKASAPLSDCDSIIWMASVIDYLTPQLIPSYVSPYSYSAADVARVQTAGQWSTWLALWHTWMTARQNDGTSAALTTMPTSSANWNQTIIVDGVTVNNISAFPQPQQYTRLTVKGVEKTYLTYTWDTVTSTCLTASNETDIQQSPSVGTPLTGSARDAEIDSVLALSGSLTDAQKVQAEFWAGSAVSTFSPPMMCVWLWKEYVRSVGVSCAPLVYSLLDLAIHLFEGGRVTWGIKGLYMQDRPIQEVRRRYTGQSVASWNGTIDGAQWVPYQRDNFVTPPFPDFTSGHSNFTKSLSLTMNKWFGPTLTKNPIVYDGLPWMSTLFQGVSANAVFGDFVVAAGASSIQPGVAPAAPVTLSFSTWEDIATSAGMSRLYGGIHTMSAHTAAQAVAVLVDGYINSTWNITPPPPIHAMAPPNVDAGAVDIATL